MNKLFSIFSSVLLYISVAFGQAAVDIPLTLSDGSATVPMAVGLDLTATTCLDTLLGEQDRPPLPPAGVFDVRFDLAVYGCGPLSTLKDYRNAPAFPFTGNVQHTLLIQRSVPGLTVNVNYDIPTGAVMTITDNINGTIYTSGPLTGIGVFAISGTGSNLSAFLVTMTYTNIGPAQPGPVFAVNPLSLNFGFVNLGDPVTQTITVSNPGTTNSMTLTSASITNTNFVVAANPPTTFPIVIPAQGSYQFDVTFTPTVVGVSAGNIVFESNAPGSPHSVPVTGEGIELQGLIFQNESVYRLEDHSYTDRMQIIAASNPIHAFQFRLYTNSDNSTDETILSFLSIEKGSDLADPNWVLDYNVFRGPITGNGASKDLIVVLVYNTSNGTLASGDHTDLLRINYRVANLPGLEDSVKSSILIQNAEASTIEGFPVNITPNPDMRKDLEVYGLNTKSGLGDVNGDGCIDILDLIMVVDHIVGRDTLEGGEFARANIAPWPTGSGEPVPDSVVNVQDLSVIQNIILTGQYPDGSPVSQCIFAVLPKSNGDADAKVTFYINNDGISAFLDSKVAIRGAQIEFNNVQDNPNNMVINTELGQGYYLSVEELLRTLMYDRMGQDYINAGINFMADMPFYISKPEEISIEKLVLVDINRQKLGNIEIELIYGAPALPLDYILFQNYPNPFNPTTSVKFQVPQTSDVKISIYDMLGQEVRTLFAGEVLRGTYSVDWDGVNNAGDKVVSGTYIYRMIAGEFVQSKKMVLIK